MKTDLPSQLKLLNAAIEEAERFLKKAKRVRIDDYSISMLDPATNAAAKRASMDLTKALAAYRLNKR